MRAQNARLSSCFINSWSCMLIFLVAYPGDFGDRLGCCLCFGSACVNSCCSVHISDSITQTPHDTKHIFFFDQIYGEHWTCGATCTTENSISIGIYHVIRTDGEHEKCSGRCLLMLLLFTLTLDHLRPYTYTLNYFFSVRPTYILIPPLTKTTAHRNMCWYTFFPATRNYARRLIQLHSLAIRLTQRNKSSFRCTSIKIQPCYYAVIMRSDR